MADRGTTRASGAIGRWAAIGAASVALHVLVVVPATALLLRGSTDTAPDEDEPMVVEVVEVEAVPDPVPTAPEVAEAEPPEALEREPLPEPVREPEPETARPPEATPEPDPEPVEIVLRPEPVEATPPPPPPPPEPPKEALPAVAQAESNDEEADRVTALADRANRVERETVAIRESATPTLDPGHGAEPDAETSPARPAAPERSDARPPAPRGEQLAMRTPRRPEPERPSPRPDRSPPAAGGVPRAETRPAPAAPSAPSLPGEAPPLDEAGEVAGDRASPAAPPEPTADPLRAFRPGAVMDDIEARQARGIEPGALAVFAKPDVEAWQGTFGTRDGRDVESLQRAEREEALWGDHAERWERTKASLNHWDLDVTTGTETHLNTAASPGAGYIAYLHDKIHPRWTGFLRRLDFGEGDAMGVGGGLSDPRLRVVLEMTIGGDGEVRAVKVVQASGELLFDGEAIDLLHGIGPHAPPPASIRSEDGMARVRWAFHRDSRQCGTFGASIRFRKE